MEAGQWSVVDTGFARFLGKFKETIPASMSLTGETEAIFIECIRLESVNVPIPAKGGMAVGSIGVTTPPVPWRPTFDRETAMHFPVSRVIWYAPISEDDVASVRKEMLSRSGGGVGHG